MKNEKKLVLELNELPQRAERLDPEKIQEIFGGCYKSNGVCFTGKDCCDDPDPLVTKLCLASVVGGRCYYIS